MSKRDVEVRLLKIAAIVCFVVALLLTVGMFNGEYTPWLVGGLLAWALSSL